MPDYRKFFLITGCDGPDIECFLDIVGIEGGDKKRTTATLGFRAAHEDAHSPRAAQVWTPHPKIRERWGDSDQPVQPVYVTFVGEYEVKSLLTVLAILGREAASLRAAGPLKCYQGEENTHGTTRIESLGVDGYVGVNDTVDLSQLF
jgi:hypothetical protein